MCSSISSTGGGSRRRGGGGTSHAPGPSHSGAQDSQKNDLSGLFECPVCFEYALPPIYQVSSAFICVVFKFYKG